MYNRLRGNYWPIPAVAAFAIALLSTFWAALLPASGSPEARGTALRFGLPMDQLRHIARSAYRTQGVVRLDSDDGQYRFEPVAYPNEQYNSLYGINDDRDVAGYYQAIDYELYGYTAQPSYRAKDFMPHAFPGSVETVVFGINNKDDICGLWLNSNDNDYGFIKSNHHYESYSEPNANPNPGYGTALIGLNDNGVAVGYYYDASEVEHAFALDRSKRKYYELTLPVIPPTNVIATGINDRGDIVGAFSDLNNTYEEGFLLHDGGYRQLYLANALVLPVGINNDGEISGTYIDVNGAHGFTYKNGKFHTIDVPGGIAGTTEVTGINNHGDLVGFYEYAPFTSYGFVAKKKA